MARKRHYWYPIRKLAGAPWNCAVVVVNDSDDAPKLTGEGPHYETMGGKHIAYPTAYAKVGWSNMRYCHSSREVHVGREWLRVNMPDVLAAWTVERVTKSLEHGR